MKSFIEQINHLILIGAIASFVWTTAATFIYFDAIISQNEYVRDPLYSCFNWKEISTQKVNSFRLTSSGKLTNDYTKQSTISLPKFNMIGYVKFILLPMIVGWLLACVLIFLHLGNIYKMVWQTFQSFEIVNKLFVVGLISYVLLLLINDGCPWSAIMWLFFIFVITPSLIFGVYHLSRYFWACTKVIVYGLFYAATKAIVDAKNKN